MRGDSIFARSWVAGYAGLSQDARCMDQVVSVAFSVSMEWPFFMLDVYGCEEVRLAFCGDSTRGIEL